MPYYFTSESVSEGHPDKVSDQISDAILDEFLRQDPTSKVACETFCTTGLVVVGGEVKSDAYVDVQKITRDVIARIGYTKSEYMFDANSCGILTALHEQSPDINQGVVRKKPEEQGAGDQGMMFGYACDETDNYMPVSLEIAHQILLELARIRKEGKKMKYLRPDAKSQVTIEYNDRGRPNKVHTIVVSTQHDDFAEEKVMLAKIKEDVIEYLMPRVIRNLPKRVRKLFGRSYRKTINFHVNPTGKFVIGGPHGDVGLTGRKIIVDTYGGKGAHGGGAFSGKDPSKVDRSAAYASRHIAKNLVAAGVAKEVLVQVSYAIGVAEPIGIFVNTYGTSKVRDSRGKKMKDSEIADIVKEVFDMRPYAIINRLGLRNPIYSETAAYGHMGREAGKKTITVKENGKDVKKTFETFTWEKLDYVDKLVDKFQIEDDDYDPLAAYKESLVTDYGA